MTINDSDEIHRKVLASEMNVLVNVFQECFNYSYSHNTLTSKISTYLSKNYETRLKLLNIFQESSIEWLRLQEEKFEAIHNDEPELKLTEEEFEAMKRQLLR